MSEPPSHSDPGHHEDVFATLAPARRRLARLVLASVVALIVTATVLGLVRVTGGTDPARPVAQDQLGPVLLVPGYGGGTSGLNRLADALRASGRDAQVVIPPAGGTGDLREQARNLATAVTAARTRSGAPSVDVVGYSAGGVVARLWVRDFGGATLARRVITLGAPHHGTELAALAAGLGGGCPPACEQLAPDSELLRGLNQGDETPVGPAFVSVWTAQDEVVVPPDSARIDGAVDLVVQDVCAAAQVSHSELPANPLVERIVATELSGATATSLGAGDCARLSS